MYAVNPLVWEYSGLSRQELMRHVRFCCKALADGEQVTVFFPDDRGRIHLKKRNFKSRPHCLELQISAGYFSYMIVQQVATMLEERGVVFRIKFTPHRHLHSKIISLHELTNIFTPTIVTDIIVCTQEVANVAPDDFRILYSWGQFEEGCTISGDDPVEIRRAAKLGYAVGRAFGHIVRLFTS